MGVIAQRQITPDMTEAVTAESKKIMLTGAVVTVQTRDRAKLWAIALTGLVGIFPLSAVSLVMREPYTLS